MKRITLLFFILIIAFFSKINSQVLLIEDFNYPAGDSIGAHDWVYFSGATNTLMVVSPGLTFTGYPGSGVGNCTRVRNNGNDNYKAFSPDSIGNLYAAFMVKVDSAATGDYFVGFLPPTSTTNYTARVYAKDSLGNVSFGISKSATSQGTIAWSAPAFLKGTTYLLVLKYKFNSGTTDDEASIFVFTSPVIPPVEPPVATAGPVTSTANDAPLGRIALRQGSTASSPTLNIDGIRIFNDWTQLVSVKKITQNVPENYYLNQNYPNPFNPSTTIRFSIPKNDFVNLVVYNALGQAVETLIQNEINAGDYEVSWNASNMTSGIYFYKITTSEFTDMKKMILVK